MLFEWRNSRHAFWNVLADDLNAIAQRNSDLGIAALNRA